MKSYYCFVPQVGKLTPESKVFKVAVGISERDQVKLKLVSLYAADTNLFFRIWDSTTDFELDCRFDPMVEGRFLIGRGFKIVSVSISKLYDAIINGYVDSLDFSPNETRNYFRMSSTLSSRFFFKNQASQNKKNVPTHPRKNLSDEQLSDGLRASIGFALLIVLYWIGCLVRAWENSMF